MHAIKVKNASKEYGPHRALDSVSLDVKHGECFGLLGTNGAGKSTLLNAIAGLLSLSSGSIEVLGHDVEKEERVVKRLLGHCYGYSNYLGNLTGRENLRVQAYAHGIENADERIDALAKLVGLPQVDEAAGTYSSGMTQKLSLMHALLHDPPVLLVDELTAGLDVDAARAVRKVLAGLKGKKTIVLTTHYMREADELCDRIALMHRGRVVAMATPHALKRTVRDYDLVELVTNNNSKALKVASALCTAELNNGSVYVQVRDELDALLASLVEAGVRVQKVRVHEPSLDEVFYALGERQ